MIEAGLWCSVALLAPTALAWLRRRVPAVEAAADLGPWAHGLLPGFLALMRGAVTPYEFGLSGFALTDWIVGAVLIVAVAGGAGLLLRKRSFGWQQVDPVDAVLDETRWGLYRGSGVAWTGALWAGAAVGLGLCLVEAVLKGGGRPFAAEWARRNALGLFRPVPSFLFFLLTGNAWLTAVGQAGLILLLRELTRRRGGATPT